MEFAVLFTRQECEIIPDEQSFMHFVDIKDQPYFIRIFKDTLDPVPIQSLTGGLFVYIENGRIEIVPPPPKLTRSKRIE